jgi:hypothetical protein
MGMNQEVMIDAVRRNLLISTELSINDVQAAYNQTEFMALVHRNIALKVAETVFRQIAPAIDEAMRNIKFTDTEQ